jgi:hypothetical protein
MSRGRYLSLEEARKAGQIKQFCKEHETNGNEKLFDETLSVMAKPAKKTGSGDQTSKKG